MRWFGSWCGTIVALCALVLGTATPPVTAQEASGMGDSLTYPQRESVPPWALERLSEAKLGEAYRISTALNPFYLTGDVDGDRRVDVAILIRQISSGKLGIAVLRAAGSSAELLGAGVEVGNGGDDFAWMDCWRVEHRPKAGGGAGATGADALLVGKTESASALLTWDGKRFAWTQEGD